MKTKTFNQPNGSKYGMKTPTSILMATPRQIALVFAIQFVVATSVHVHAQVPELIGDTYTDFCSINEQYDPATDSWSARASMPLPPRENFPATDVNGRIYIFGGVKPPSVYNYVTYDPATPLASVLEYEPSTDVWTSKADMPTPRSSAAAVAIDGKIYVVGGGDATGHGPYSTLEVYDPSTNTWETKTPAPYLCEAPAAGAIDGILYVAGGLDDSATYYSNVLQAYDPATDTWTRKADMPTARATGGGAVVNNIFYVIGGQGPSCCAVLNTVEAYDPATDTWTSKTPMNTARNQFGAPQVLNGQIYVAGGFTNGATTGIGLPTDSVESYDPSSNAWNPSHTPLLTTRSAGAVASANGLMYVIGGYFPGAAIEGQQFIYQIVATNQPTSYSGGYLYGAIPGLNFDTTTGLLYGTVQTGLPVNGAENSLFFFHADNAAGPSSNGGVHFTVYNPPPGPIIISNTTATGRINQPFSFQLLSENSTSETRYSVGNLPPGLSVDRVTGLISGTPTTAGNFVSPVIVTDGTGKGVSYLQLTITDDPDIPIITSSGTLIVSPGEYVSYTITADADGNCSYIGTDGVEDGALPPDLTFDPSTCTISGTYTGADTPGSISNRAMVPIITRDGVTTDTGTLVGTCQMVFNNTSGTGTAPLNFVSLPTYTITVKTNPAGRSFTVDGITYTAAQTFSWVSGSSHTIATTSPQRGGTGVQYVWTKWSDDGAISHTVAPTTNTTYTATFKTQYRLTMTHGTGGRTSPPSGWKNKGATISISATPANGYSFSNWTGSGTGSYSGPNNPASITMGGPITENANFIHN